MSAIFEYGWREDHARTGDQALKNAGDALNALAEDSGLPVSAHAALIANIHALAAIAQAHYAAANIRTRPIRDAELPAPQVGTGWIGPSG